jgi:hypothetical protein
MSYVGFFAALLVSSSAGLLEAAGPSTSTAQKAHARLSPYLEVIKRDGMEPIHFVVQALDRYDLLIFDDALHPAVEPFDFYRQLLKDDAFLRHVPTIFLELIPSNQQRHVEAYLNAPTDDPRLLFPAFQNNADGMGFNFKTYFDLLKAVRETNRQLPPDRRIKVIAAGGPTYWCEIQTPRDLELYYQSTRVYDYHMYATVLEGMDRFRGNKKGILLTNTRHAYKGIKHKDGQYFWDTGTFFAQWHPGKTYSIRLHNLALFLRAIRSPDPKSGKTLEGMERLDFKFVRMARGLWDSAFRANGDRPVAIPLAQNVFGEEPYIGNHQPDALPNQRMQDAYDALIFLGPLEKLRQTATVDFIYTPAFRQELKRRYRIRFTAAELAEMFKQNHAGNLDELLAKTLIAEPAQPLQLAKGLGPIDEWKQSAK